MILACLSIQSFPVVSKSKLKASKILLWNFDFLSYPEWFKLQATTNGPKFYFKLLCIFQPKTITMIFSTSLLSTQNLRVWAKTGWLWFSIMCLCRATCGLLASTCLCRATCGLLASTCLCRATCGLLYQLASTIRIQLNVSIFIISSKIKLF